MQVWIMQVIFHNFLSSMYVNIIDSTSILDPTKNPFLLYQLEFA